MTGTTCDSILPLALGARLWVPLVLPVPVRGACDATTLDQPTPV
ncbi:MAG: hypothetical protein AB1736_05315 [Chloroflexota bacterium]